MTFNNELNLFLKARYPILYINTIEEERVEYVIRKNVKINRSPSGVANDAVMSNVSPICFNSKFHFYVIFIIY